MKDFDFDFEFVDHGEDHEQYFPGAGASFTKWDDCVTGIGDSAHEAASNALDQFCSVHDVDSETLQTLESAANQLPKLPKTSGRNESLHYYVTFYWKN